MGVAGFYRLASRESGFSTKDTVIAVIDFRDYLGHTDGPSRVESVLRAIRRAPGVTAASLLSTPPLMGATSSGSFTARLGNGGVQTEHDVWIERVSSEYFAAAGTRLLRGTAFREDERYEDRVCVLGIRAAKAFFGREDPVGKPLFFDETSARAATRGEEACRVIGVAQDAHFRSMASTSDKTVYLLSKNRTPIELSILVRAANRDLAAGAVRVATRAAAPGCPPPDISSLGELIANDLLRERILMLLSCASAALTIEKRKESQFA